MRIIAFESPNARLSRGGGLIRTPFAPTVSRAGGVAVRRWFSWIYRS